MMFPLYTLAWTGVVLTLAPYFLVRGRRSGKYLWSLSARLGRNPPDLGPKRAPRVWVHALSLGEVLSALELVAGLQSAGYEVCLSTTTISGHQLAQERLAPEVWRLSFPLDWPPAVRRVLEAVRPDVFVLVETDIWPNFLAGLKARGVPALLVNGRVSPRTLTRARLLRPWWSQVLGLFAVLGMQSRLDRERILRLGADPSRVVVTGNLKFDRPRPESGDHLRAELLAETGLGEGTWLVGGSTHPGEDEALLDLLEELQPRYPGLKLLLAPRDWERFERVWELILERGLPAARRSGPQAGPQTRVFLLDSQGELDRFLELADLVFVGKSLPGAGEGGGHNLLEAAARSKPVLFGPRMDNFPEIARLIRVAGGGWQVADRRGLVSAVAALLASPERRQEMGRRALSVFEAQRGAMERTLELIHQTRAGSRGLGA